MAPALELLLQQNRQVLLPLQGRALPTKMCSGSMALHDDARPAKMAFILFLSFSFLLSTCNLCGGPPLLFRAERPVLEPHILAVALSAPCSVYVVLGAALEAYLEVEPALLGYLLLESISDWHFYPAVPPSSLLCLVGRHNFKEYIHTYIITFHSFKKS
jgi:hypothetical protein